MRKNEKDKNCELIAIAQKEQEMIGWESSGSWRLSPPPPPPPQRLRDEPKVGLHAKETARYTEILGSCSPTSPYSFHKIYLKFQ